MNPAALTREARRGGRRAPVLDGDAVAPYLRDATEARVSTAVPTRSS